MKKKIYILLLILLSFNLSCDDGFLDTAPYHGLSTSLIFTSDEYALLAVRGAYNALAQDAFGPEFYVYVTAIGPEGYPHFARAAWGPAHKQGLATPSDARFINNYRNFYRPIIYANDIIAGLENNNNVSEEVRNRFIGEAKFIRGLCYFHLFNLFGGVVILDKPTPPSETYLPRNTKEEVIQFCIDDFTDAITKLPMTNSGRATKGAAIAMLGKTYLYNKQWAEAASQFELLLSAPYGYNLVANYEDNFRFATQNNEESVFELQFAMVPGAGSTFNNWFGNRTTGRSQGQDYAELSIRAFKAFTYADNTPIDFSTIPKRSDYPSDIAFGLELTPWYINTLEGVDKRLHQSAILPGSFYVGWTERTYQLRHPTSAYRTATPPSLWITFGDQALIPIRKYVTIGQENDVGRTDGPTNFPLIRFADVLLMYAEAKNEASGPSAEVYNAVDRVRTRAELTGLAILKPGMTQDEMRREIWLERFRELMFESILYFDVKRWNVAHTNDPVFGLNNEEWDYRLETLYYTNSFNAERDYLWPIPLAEMDINPLMVQNPGWSSK